MSDIEIKMMFKKSTKNTHVFEAVDTLSPAIPTLYVSKLAMTSPLKKIIVSVKDDS